MAEPCPVHGPNGEKGNCDLCLSHGKNIILCEEHGYQHVEANNCILCIAQHKGVRGKIVKKATAPNPKSGRWPETYRG